MFDNILTIWSDQPGLSLAIWFAVLVLMMYLGRASSHQLIRSTGRAAYCAMRLASRSIGQLRDSQVQRNKEVILGFGADNIEYTIEREFSRVNALVIKDLSTYPVLHRKISDTIDTIQQSFYASTDAPPMPPAWLEAVDAISAIPRTGDKAVCGILDNIQSSIEIAHNETLKVYQQSSSDRHKQLGEMRPLWGSLTQTMARVKGTVDGLDERTAIIDKQMERYEQIRAGADESARVLTASSLTQFFIAGLVLIIAALGGVINFQLIAMPMAEMVGGTSYIGAMRTSDIAALVIIMVEVAMGLFLMETLRITRLFPVIGAMDDKMRVRMMIITFSILTILATVEASLAYMRDLLALDREALTQSLSGITVTEAQFRWIPSLGQMIMGFILPFALAFVAIPLESFIHSLRTVLGIVIVAMLHGLTLITRMLGNIANHISKITINLYDLLIMIPLSIERFIRSQTGKTSPTNVEPLVSNSSNKKPKPVASKKINRAKPAKEQSEKEQTSKEQSQ